MPYCPKCGSPIVEGAAFCPKCGNKLSLEAETSPEKGPEVDYDKPIVEAKRSFVGHYGLFLPFCLVLFFWLVIPLIALICMIIANRTYRHVVYPDRYVYRGGLLSKTTRTQTLTKILSINVSQSFKGKIFHYGNIYVNIVGRGGIDIQACKRPEEVAKALDPYVARGNEVRQIVAE